MKRGTDYAVKCVGPKGRSKKNLEWGYRKRLSDPTTVQGRCYGL